jgi:hypothetical protein
VQKEEIPQIMEPEKVIEEMDNAQNASQEVPPQEIQPQEVPPQEIPPQEVPPQEVPPQEIPPQEVPPQQIPPQQIPPQQIPPQQIPPQYIPPQMSATPAEPPKKGKGGKVVLIIVGVLIALAVAAGAIIAVLKISGGISSKSNEKELVYMKGKKLYYTSNMTKEDNSLEICSVKIDDDYVDELSYLQNAAFSEDGKYLYFYSKIDEYDGNKLERIPVSKIKDGDNDSSIEEIASGVTSYYIIGNSDIVYCNSKSQLFIYDGKEDEKIGRNVSGYWIGEDSNTVYYYTYDDNDNLDLAVFNLGEMESTTIAENVYMAADDISAEFPVYLKYNNDDDYDYDDDDYYYDYDYSAARDLYFGDEKIAEGVKSLCGDDAETKTIYYTKSRTEVSTAYDFVDDPYAENEALLTEPDKKDYMTPCQERDAMSEEDYEYYSRYPDEKRYFYYWLYYDYDTEMEYTYKWVEDENGDDNLQIYFYDDENDAWYYYDGDSYSEAAAAYSSSEERISLREELKNYSFSVSYLDLYKWDEKSGETLVAQNVKSDIYVVAQSGIVFYEKCSEEDLTVSIDDVYYAEEVEYMVNDAVSYNPGIPSYCMDGTESVLGSAEYLEGVYPSSSGRFILVYSYDDEYNFSGQCYELGGDTLVESGDSIDSLDNAIWKDDVLYYFVSDEDGDTALWTLDSGKQDKILKDVSTSAFRIYDNGMYTAFTDYSYGEGGTLRLYSQDGNSVKISSQVSNYYMIDKDLIVYLKDGKLCVFTGEDKDDVTISKDVTYFTCHRLGYTG